MQDYVDQEQLLWELATDTSAAFVPVTMAGVFRIPDAMWERIEPLIRAPAKVHRFGGGSRRVPDRVVLDATSEGLDQIVARLRSASGGTGAYDVLIRDRMNRA